MVAKLGCDMTRSASAIRIETEIFERMEFAVYLPGDGFSKKLGRVARRTPNDKVIFHDISYTISKYFFRGSRYIRLTEDNKCKFLHLLRLRHSSGKPCRFSKIGNRF